MDYCELEQNAVGGLLGPACLGSLTTLLDRVDYCRTTGLKIPRMRVAAVKIP
jgi:hypothetical protein